MGGVPENMARTLRLARALRRAVTVPVTGLVAGRVPYGLARALQRRDSTACALADRQGPAQPGGGAARPFLSPSTHCDRDSTRPLW